MAYLRLPVGNLILTDGIQPFTPGSPAIQLGHSGTALSGNRALGLGTGLFSNGAWWQEIGKDRRNAPVHAYSDLMMTRFTGNTKIEMRGVSQGTPAPGMPINVVPHDQPLLPITISLHQAPDDPATVPFAPGQSEESWYNPPNQDPPQPGDIQNDHHVIAFVANSDLTAMTRLVEQNRVESEDGGLTWLSVGGASFDMTTGAERPDGYPSADAAGLPVGPLLINRQMLEAGVRGPLRLAMPGPGTTNKWVWPGKAPTTAGAGAAMVVNVTADASTGATSISVRALRNWSGAGALLPVGTLLHFAHSGVTATVAANVNGGVTHITVNALSGPIPSGDCATVPICAPIGSYLRMRDDYYQAHYAAASPIVKAIFECLRWYGGPIADVFQGSGFYLNGITDDRYTTGEITELASIPCMTAFEVLDYQLHLEWSGPTSGPSGQPATFTIQHMLPGMTNFTAPVFYAWSQDGGATIHEFNFSPAEHIWSDANRGPHTFTFTPPAPGNYLLKVQHSVMAWMEPDWIPFLAT